MIEPVTVTLRFLARDLDLPQEQVQSVVNLLDEGFPIPFIARYRKDKTGNLDEDALRAIEEELKSQRALCERKLAILKTIESHGKLTPELEQKIRDAKSLKRLEDLYLPYKQKRQTLASEAKERGLEPLALEIFEGTLSPERLESKASEFIYEDKNIKSVADALLGAGHIIAEMYTEKLELIQQVRDLAHRTGKLVTSRVMAKISEPSEVSPVEIEKVDMESPATATTAETIVETPAPAEPVVEETNAETTNTEPEPANEPASESGDTEPGIVAPDTIAEPVDDVQAVTEQFQQWKEAQEEKGIPTVTSQNTLKKKKKEELKKKKAEAKVRQQEHFERQFSDYFNYTSPLRNLPPHCVLAVNRGERVKVIKVKIEVDEAKILENAKTLCIPAEHPHAEFLAGCLKDALNRRMIPVMEREIRNDLTDSAERQAMRVFGKNLRHLLLQAPLNRKRVLALDPGFRHGCKMVPLDEFGNVLDFETVYLHGNAERRELAVQKIVEMVKKFNITVIAIGNGTGCRETEEAVSKMIADHFPDSDLAYVIVNEAGASVYSASPIAKEEFPNYDVMLRGAVSIGRRLQDPLNELVKIEPASLGVGMYPHDLKNKHLKDTLVEVVESCVNFVGVDLNTATPAILRYVAGLNQMTARRIYDFRRENGPFRKREDLKKVAGFGEAAFTHSAGFLKVIGGENPLDGTWIHPESYEPAQKVLEKLGFSLNDLTDSDKVKEIAAKIAEEKVGELASRFANELEVGLFTVRDILENLSRPGRDPREALPPPIFKKGVLHMEDLSVGMELSGTVLNVVDFGAFVDIGLHDSGLIHISQMADHFIRDAHEKVAVGDIVRVWVVEVDPKRHRISLTMLPPGTEKRPPQSRQQPRPPRREEARQERPTGDRPPRSPKKDGNSDSAPAPRGEARQGDRPKRDDRQRREGGRRDDRHGDRHGNRDRGPRTFVAAPKEKEIKPISEDMKKGKEPLRSFGDLAQLLGRVQVPDPVEEKKKKKEEERRQRAEGRQKEEPNVQITEHEA